MISAEFDKGAYVLNRDGRWIGSVVKVGENRWMGYSTGTGKKHLDRKWRATVKYQAPELVADEIWGPQGKVAVLAAKPKVL